MQKEYSYLGNYGIVKIIGGKHKGKFGYYDGDDIDDDDRSKSVIYFGDMLSNATYYLIEPQYITNDFTIEDLKKRKSEIEHKLWKKLSKEQRLELIEEKTLIDNELIYRFENYVSSNKTKGKKVFLSHSSKDKPIVTSVALDLNEKGISTWLDAFDIRPGESIVTKINEGLNKCDYILLFLSENSVKSDWVTKEWETMLWEEVNSQKIKIIPIKIGDCEIPRLLQTKKYINLSEDYNYGIHQLIETIKKYEEQ